jgi:hypothetical protein
LVIVACGGAAEEEVVEETVEEAVVESLDSPAVTTATSVKTGTGVTAEPCPAEIGKYQLVPIKVKDVYISDC